MQLLMATLVAVTLMVQAQTPSKRFPDVQLDGLNGAVRTVRTSVERSPGVTEPVGESTYDEQGRLVARAGFERGVLAWSSKFENLQDGTRVEERTYAVRPPVTRLEPKNGRVPPRYFTASGAELFCRTIDADSFGRPLAEYAYTGSEPKKHPHIARVVYQYVGGRPSAATYYERFPEVQVRREVFALDRRLVWSETIAYEQGKAPEKRTWTDTLDPAGNWTRRIDRRVRGGQETVVTYIRTIEYH